jgi:hypothetical protein
MKIIWFSYLIKVKVKVKVKVTLEPGHESPEEE